LDAALLAERSEHAKVKEAWDQERKDLVQDYQKKLEMEAQIREHLIQAKEQREQELSNLVELRHNDLKAMTAKYETTQEAFIQTREELSAVKAKLAAKEEEVEVAVRERRNVKTEFDAYKEFQGATSENQTQAIADLKNSVSDLTVKVQEKSHQIEVKQIMVNENQESIDKLKQMLLLEEQRRRDVHNALQELKGNIRVFSRVRPSAPGQASALQVNASAGRVALQYTNETFDKTTDYNFSFDRVFDQDAGQEEVFEEVSDLVQSALDGYKVCIFAYGQTGSGKTHTMQGPQNDPKAWGVIPRSLRQIVKTAIGMRSKGWVYDFHASFLEVYNESIRDLLHTEVSGPSKTHTIIRDNAWGFVVTDMTTKEVTSTDEAQALDEIRGLMTIAGRQRSVGSTRMNDESSRSHSLFSLYLHGVNSDQDTELFGALHLVDLAGSERLEKSCAEGARLKETQNINRSLSSLADVFLAKAENRNHIPFRNSKLTHLLEPCLSGHGKTLMMLNIAPEETHSHESLCSLRFAKQVSQCHTGGKPKKAVKTASASSASTAQTSQGSRHPPHMSRTHTPQGSRPNSSHSSRSNRSDVLSRSTNCFGV
jgi:kinesin family protein C1